MFRAAMLGAVVGAAIALAVAFAGPAIIERISERPGPAVSAVQVPPNFVAALQAHLAREYGSSAVASSTSLDTVSALQQHLALEYGSATVATSPAIDIGPALQAHLAREYRTTDGNLTGPEVREALYQHVLQENGGR